MAAPQALLQGWQGPRRVSTGCWELVAPAGSQALHRATKELPLKASTSHPVLLPPAPQEALPPLACTCRAPVVPQACTLTLPQHMMSQIVPVQHQHMYRDTMPVAA